MTSAACDLRITCLCVCQLEECTRGADELKSLGGAVTAACGGALGEKVRGQIQEHERRRALAEERVRALRTTSPTSVKERSRARRPETCATLARVRELLLTTSAHPADRASLAVRHSLVKVRSPPRSHQGSRVAPLGVRPRRPSVNKATIPSNDL